LSKRRSSFQIAIDVLTVMKQGESRSTRIMYSTNLSWKSLRSTLGLLVHKGYVEEIPHPSMKQRRYYITPEGENVLRYYDRLETLVKVDATI
jgi:predicted transcriptional regulator